MKLTILFLWKLAVFHSIPCSSLKEQQFQENFYHRKQEYGIILSQQLNAAENFQSNKPYKCHSYHNYSLQGITALLFISIFKLMIVIRKGSVKHNSLRSEAAAAVPYICLLTAPTAGFLVLSTSPEVDIVISLLIFPLLSGSRISVCPSCCHPGAPTRRASWAPLHRAHRIQLK